MDGGDAGGEADVSDVPDPTPQDSPQGEPERPVLRYPPTGRPEEHEPLTRRQNWLVWLFFVPPLAYLAFLIVRSILAK
jgi:hypothetical protein